MNRTIIPPAPCETLTIPFAGDTPWLAPLAGYSDLPFRLLCREHGAACCTTEMVSAKGLLYQSPGTAPLLRSTPDDQPLIVQLFGGEEESLAKATHLLKDAGYRFFDLNVGCSVPKVMRQNAGAGMLRDPALLLAAAKAMIQEAGPGYVGFKLRLGLDSDHSVLPDLPLALEDLGAGWITLHPRTARQGFQGTCDWSQIKRLVSLLRIPVVASGDLLSAEDGLRCLETTGAATLMYARGALHNPGIFSDHMNLVRGLPREASSEAKLKRTILRHLELVQNFSNGRDQTARMRGILSAYVRGLPKARAIRTQLCAATRWEELIVIVEQWLRS